MYLFTWPVLLAVDFIQQKASSSLSVAPRVVMDRLIQVLDFESGGVPKHLGKIADFVYEWEGKVADELELTKTDVNSIKLLHKDRLDLQV